MIVLKLKIAYQFSNNARYMAGLPWTFQPKQIFDLDQINPQFNKLITLLLKKNGAEKC